MQTVWLLRLTVDYEGDTMLGVYASREEAVSAARAFMQDENTRSGWDEKYSPLTPSRFDYSPCESRGVYWQRMGEILTVTEWDVQ